MKYIKPETKFEEFEEQDVISTSLPKEDNPFDTEKIPIGS